jgi:nucleoid-associated protein YgaU
MMARLRRILVSALLGLLVGLGLIVALLTGRRPAGHGAAIATRANATTRAGAGLGTVLGTAPSTGPGGTPGRTSGPVRARRGRTAALVGLVLVLGLVAALYGVGGAFLGLPQPTGDGAAKPLAALSPPAALPPQTKAPSPSEPPDGSIGRMTDPQVQAPTGSVAPTGPGKQAAPPPAENGAPAAPSFDIVRVEPNGDAVIAGRAPPNATVDLLVDGKPAATGTAGADGHFTLTPPALPTGSSEIGLRATGSGGSVSRSPASIAVAVAPGRDAKPLVALTMPDRPTVVLSQPDPMPGTASASTGQEALRDGRDRMARQAPRGSDADAAHPEAGSREPEARAPQTNAPGQPRPTDGASTVAEAPPPSAGIVAATTEPPKIVSIDAQAGGGLFVTARAAPGATVRFYLNDTLIAPATVARDGTVTFAIGHGVKPGAYQIRVDRVEAGTGKVRDRAEVPFSVPDSARDGGIADATARAAGTPDAARQPSPGAAGAQRDPAADPGEPPQASRTGTLAANGPATAPAAPAEVYIPGINTARIVRGDSLWKISRRTYGEGERYTVIYDANQDQIRDPDLIYPGQIFVLPPENAAPPGGDGRPR